MSRIVVPGTGLPVPAIGFGCSSLASVGKKKTLELLGTAFDAGVRHFDVARFYGYGEAEALLGAFVRSRRAEVTITTKFGIEPPARTNVLRYAMRAGRRFVRLLPTARGIVQRRAQTLVKRGRFSAQEAQSSLETSLRELGTDYVDFFLLHDYEPSDRSMDELVEFLVDRTKAGVIRYFGIGTEIESVLRVLQVNPELCDIVQFENSVLTRNREKLRDGQTVRPLMVVNHGSLGASYRSVVRALEARRALVANWSTQLGVDCSGEEAISGLMLNYAVYANPDGLLLFSSRDASRTKQNIRAVLEPRFSLAQIELFGVLVERDLIPVIQTAQDGTASDPPALHSN
jgi:D-threo-aldose 1-dehydrogenase